LKIMFDRVHCAKPRSSRASSVEAFVVCEGFRPPEGFRASLEDPLGIGVVKGQESTKEASTGRERQKRTVREDGVTILEFEDDEEDENRWIAPFLACGDLSAWDADATYRLPDDRVSLDPVQPPTAPPYKRALEMRRRGGGAYGKTSK
ncbi:MAG: hypothetical protein M1830_004014, partial [Pleopsidium flavum]